MHYSVSISYLGLFGGWRKAIEVEFNFLLIVHTFFHFLQYFLHLFPFTSAICV